ncbi:MAG: DUF6252 family protein [Candidatus Micrarchaeaceae archaeon]
MKATAETAPEATASAIGGNLSATINGIAWQAAPISSKDHDDAIATIDSKTGLVTIRGTSNPSAGELQQIEITLKSAQVGTYTLSPLFAHLQTAQYNIGNDTSQVYFIHEKQSGQAVISQSDGHRLKGTFSFVARNSQGKDIHISNGTFDVAIQQ